MLNARPGAFVLIGAGAGPDGALHDIHTPRYDFNDDILTLGAGYWVSLVHEELG
jgi:metal-dependent amidase/aminoacylase/carboxypeptidase family protein